MKPGYSVTARDRGRSSEFQNCRMFFTALGAYLGRYQLDRGPSNHKSKSCQVIFAEDFRHTFDDDVEALPVALKKMKNHDQFHAEINARHNQGKEFNLCHICDLNLKKKFHNTIAKPPLFSI